MAGIPLYRLLFSFFLVLCVIIAGCSDESAPADATTPTPAHPDAKYGEGDIIATASSSGESSLYLILRYDPVTDQYTKAVIEKNADGSWGHRSSDRTEKSPRATLEKIYTVKAGHVAVSIVPVITPAPLSEAIENPAGGAPSIQKMSPTSAVRDTVVSATISGSNFQNGATVKLFKAGASPINGTVTSVTAFDISCFFNLNGKNEGIYNLIVINPDGQSDSVQAVFTVGETSPVIAGMYPVTGAMKNKVPLTISGQNFRNEVKVSFTRNTTELVCDNPLSMESSKITCTLDLSANRGASAGEWTLTVINIRDGQKGTWVKKFVVTNATPDNG
jgi:hypothetical protein